MLLQGRALRVRTFCNDLYTTKAGVPMICPKCSANIDDRSYYCNRCGAAQTQAQSDAENQYASQDADRYGPREYRSDQTPPPAKGFDIGELSEKKYLLISLVCFGWAAVKGIPAAVGLLRIAIGVIPFPDHYDGVGVLGLVAAIVSVGVHLAAPLVAGVVMLKKYHNDIPQ